MFDRERYKRIIEDHFPKSGLTPERSEEIARAFLLALKRKKYWRVLGYRCSNDFSKLGHYIYTRYHGKPTASACWYPPLMLSLVAEKMEMDYKDVSIFLSFLTWRILELDQNPLRLLEKRSKQSSRAQEVVKQKPMKIAA